MENRTQNSTVHNRTRRTPQGSRTEHRTSTAQNRRQRTLRGENRTQNSTAQNRRQENTHGADFLKVAAVRAEVDELLVEEPGELELQGVVVGHVAGQDDALPHRHVQVAGRAGDGRGLWRQTQKTSRAFF